MDDSCHKLPKEEKEEEEEEEEEQQGTGEKKSTHGWLFRMKKSGKVAKDLIMRGLGWLGDRLERVFLATHPSWHANKLEPSQRVRRSEEDEGPTRDYKFEIVLGLLMFGMAAAMTLFSVFCAIPF
ncbi:hypothetical protein JOB18_022467 [Solea senegalensis]|uniref:Uncharacterized protein n=1 Tax=Solea senegalensis TaxID=28829 RepID=A0AAV6QTG2_SOLSE|nr:hypothetical protein JOB18_022467 [Solea senegalensis]